MGNRKRDLESELVRECLSGSEHAWNQFYGRYIGLVRNVVARKLGLSVRELEDVTQEVFCSLVSSLNTYDATYSLTRFVAMVAERICIRQYRAAKTAKRDGKTDPVSHHDDARNGAEVLVSGLDSQEERLGQAQLIAILRGALKTLDAGCQDLLKLRYYEDLPYAEISGILGAPRNTLAVRVKRCLDALRANCRILMRKGLTS